MKRMYIFKAFALLGVLFLGMQANAQLVNCNVFLQGQYVEVGINWNGAYGSSAAAPTGYHPSGSTSVTNSAACGFTPSPFNTGLGFVVDADQDGWTVGTPAFYGDYFMPGVPQEGWSFMADGKQVNAWNENDADSAAPFTIFTYYGLVEDTTIIVTTYWYDSVTMTMDTLHNFGYDTVWHHDTTYYMHGGNISYDTVGSSLVGTWQGMQDSVAITQITTLNMDSLFFSVRVIMTNLSVTPKENVYYMRTVDPDNDEPQSGTFQTFNKIEDQLPNPDGLTVVSARGTVHPNAYLSLGTNDPRAKSFIIRANLEPVSGTLATIYAGDTANYLYNQNDTLNTDVGIGLVFQIGHLAGVDTLGGVDSAMRTTSTFIPPNRAIINYVYSFNGGSFGSGLLRNSNLTNKNTINIYPNPVKNMVNISGLANNDQVFVYNMMGVKVANYNVQGSNACTLNIAELPSGHYLVQVVDVNGATKTKAPIQKL